MSTLFGFIILVIYLLLGYFVTMLMDLLAGVSADQSPIESDLNKNVWPIVLWPVILLVLILCYTVEGISILTKTIYRKTE